MLLLHDYQISNIKKQRTTKIKHFEKRKHL